MQFILNWFLGKEEAPELESFNSKLELDTRYMFGQSDLGYLATCCKANKGYNASVVIHDHKATFEYHKNGLVITNIEKVT